MSGGPRNRATPARLSADAGFVLAATLVAGLIGGMTSALLMPALGSSPPIVTSASSRAQPLGPTPDPRFAAAWEAVSRNSAAWPTIAALLAPTAIATSVPAPTSAASSYCGVHSLHGQVCQVAPPPTPAPTMPAACNPEILATPFAYCVWPGP